MLIETCSFLRPSLKAKLQENGFLYVENVIPLLQKHSLLTECASKELMCQTIKCQCVSSSTPSETSCIFPEYYKEHEKEKETDNNASSFQDCEVVGGETSKLPDTPTHNVCSNNNCTVNHVQTDKKCGNNLLNSADNKELNCDVTRHCSPSYKQEASFSNVKQTSTLAKDMPFFSVSELLDLLEQFKTHYNERTLSKHQNNSKQYEENKCSTNRGIRENINKDVINSNNGNTKKTSIFHEKRRNEDNSRNKFTKCTLKTIDEKTKLTSSTYKMFSLRELLKREQKEHQIQCNEGELIHENKEEEEEEYEYEEHFEATPCQSHNLTTSSFSLNRLLGSEGKECNPHIQRDSFAAFRGGIPLNTVTEISGPPGVGKTQLLMQLAVNATIPAKLRGCSSAKECVDDECLFIDTEGSFVPERLCQIAQATVLEVQQYALRQKLQLQQQHLQQEQRQQQLQKQNNANKEQMHEKRKRLQKHFLLAKVQNNESKCSLSDEIEFYQEEDEEVQVTQKLNEEHVRCVREDTNSESPLTTRRFQSSTSLSQNEVDINDKHIDDSNKDYKENIGCTTKVKTNNEDMPTQSRNKRSRLQKVTESNEEKDPSLLTTNVANVSPVNANLRHASVSTCRLSQTESKHDEGENYQNAMTEIGDEWVNAVKTKEGESSVIENNENKSDTEVEISLFKQSRQREFNSLCQLNVNTKNVSRKTNSIDTNSNSKNIVDDDDYRKRKMQQLELEKIAETYTLEYVLSHIHYIRITDLSTLMALLYDLPRLLHSSHVCTSDDEHEGNFSFESSRDEHVIYNNYHNVCNSNNNVEIKDKLSMYSNIKLVVIDSIAEPFRSFMSNSTFCFQGQPSTTNFFVSNREDAETLNSNNANCECLRKQKSNSYGIKVNENNDLDDGDRIDGNGVDVANEETYSNSVNDYSRSVNRTGLGLKKNSEQLNNRELVRRRSRLLFMCADMLRRYAHELSVTIVISNQMTSRSVLLPTNYNNGNNDRADEDSCNNNNNNNDNNYSTLNTRSKYMHSSTRSSLNTELKRSTILVPALGDIWGSQMPIRVLLSYHHYQLPPSSWEENETEYNEKEHKSKKIDHGQTVIATTMPPVNNTWVNNMQSRWHCKEDTILCTTSHNHDSTRDQSNSDTCLPINSVCDTHQYRVARLLKSPYSKWKECSFAITQRGIRDVSS